MNSSSYDQLDFLQTTRPFHLTSTVPAIQTNATKTKFGSVLNDLSRFLATAADSAAAVDGIINGTKGGSGNTSLTPQQQLALLQAQNASSASGSIKNILLVGGVLTIGGGIMYGLLKKKKR